MQTSQHSNDELAVIADGCTVMANQFDKDGSVSTTLNSAAAAIRELLFYRRLTDQPGGGTKIYVTSPSDAPGSTRPGEPLPRPFVVAMMPYAKWLIIESSPARAIEAEADLKAMTAEAERSADAADKFERLLIAERAKNAQAAPVPAESEES